MMRKCTEGKIDRILCKSISRLAKNTADFIRTLDTLHDCGVSIYFEKENIDTTEAVSSFVLTALVMPGKRKFKLIGWTIFLMFFILLVGSVVSSGFSGNIVKLIENMLLSIIGVFSDNTSSSLSGAGHRFILWEWVYNTVTEKRRFLIWITAIFLKSIVRYLCGVISDMRSCSLSRS